MGSSLANGPPLFNSCFLLRTLSTHVFLSPPWPPLQALNLTATDRRLMGLGSISRSATGQVVGAEVMAVKVTTLDPDTVRAVVREATFPEGAEALVGSSLPPLSRLV